MDDINVRIEKKFAEIRDNQIYFNDEHSLERQEFGESIRYTNSKRFDYYTAKDEVLQLELSMLQYEQDPRIFPLDRRAARLNLDNKRSRLKSLESEIM